MYSVFNRLSFVYAQRELDTLQRHSVIAIGADLEMSMGAISLLSCFFLSLPPFSLLSSSPFHYSFFSLFIPSLFPLSLPFLLSFFLLPFCHKSSWGNFPHQTPESDENNGIIAIGFWVWGHSLPWSRHLW